MNVVLHRVGWQIQVMCMAGLIFMQIAGTAGLNVPMFIALRRFTLLCTIVLERFMMGKKHDRSTIGAVGIMIGGACLHSCLAYSPEQQAFLHQRTCYTSAYRGTFLIRHTQSITSASGFLTCELHMPHRQGCCLTAGAMIASAN